jgi:hypothetical protein
MAGSFHNRYRKQTLLASANRTATTTTADRRCDGNYLRVRTVVTVDPEAASITPKIQRKNPDGTYTDVLVDAAITAVGESILEVGPGLTAAANATANALISGPYRIIVTHADGDDITYSVTAETF